MNRRSKSLTKFQVWFCTVVLASLYSATGQSSPAPRTAHTAAWDAARGQLVMFGGFDDPQPKDETWVWNGIWTLKNPADPPPARVYANMAYDEARQQVVLFGGTDDWVNGFNDTWVWDGNEWSHRFPTNRPSQRYLHGMAYDAARQEIVLFGGYDSGTRFNDTWVWNGTNWFSRSPATSPWPRGVRQSMAYDRQRQEVVLFGGEDLANGFGNDTWAWNGTNWNERTPLTSSTNRYGHALAYDEVRNRITLFGGSGFNDTWIWDGTNWLERIPQQRPTGRNGHTLTFIPPSGSLLLFGGTDESGVRFGDTWFWDGTNWLQGSLDFTDDFEAPTLNPFWRTYANAGSIVFPSTNLSHGGAQSFALRSVANAGQKSIGAYHDFPRPIYGRVSIWLYDSGADELSGNYIGFHVRNLSQNKGARMFTQDYDLGPTDGGTYYYQLFGQRETPRTSIDRTKAWHQFTIIASEQTLSMQIDGATIASGPGGVPFDRVEFEIHGPTWRPGVVVNFDDFEVTEGSVSGVGSADLSLSATVTPAQPVAGSNFTYSISVTNLGPDDATGVTVMTALPEGVSFITATTSQGSYTNQGGLVIFYLDTVTNGGSATLMIVARSHSALGVTNFILLASDQSDPMPGDNTVGLNLVVLPPSVPPSWEFMSISGLPFGAVLSSVWARNSTEAYVLGWKVRDGTLDVPDAFVYRWNGSTWTHLRDFAGHYPARVFGTEKNEVWVTLNRCSLGTAAGCGADRGGQVYRSLDKGENWTGQSLPPGVAQNELNTIDGFFNNIHVVASGGRILRFNGASWSRVHFDPVELVSAQTMVGENEGYYVTCWGWGSWDGSSWRFYGRQFDFFDVRGTWATRDATDQLHWYAVGNNHFANGIRVWKFDKSTQSFGGRTNTVFAEGSGIDIGSATGIWGSAADDVYVIGELAAASGGPRMGRIYHFDGSTWSRLTQFGEIAPPGGVHGISGDDVWVSLTDGRMLRLRKSSGTNDPPHITTHPASATGIVGSTLSFGVTARGTPPLRYKWQLNFANILGETNPVLTLTGLTPGDAGSYRAVVTNSFGSATSVVATLTVVELPAISLQPQSTNVTLGADVSLGVVASGVGLHYQWRKNGANIDGATNATLVLNGITVSDGGSYTVLVANGAGVVTSDTAEVRISVLGSPPSRDNFVNREPIQLTSGLITIVSGVNSNATKEPGEPDHARGAGGRSVWFTWQAPASGTVEFSTYGSTFDTLLAVYTGTGLSNLVAIASSDDDENNDPGSSASRFFASRVNFNALAGTAYHIALDGFGGAEGSYLLSGKFDQTVELLPEIVLQPTNRVVVSGGNAFFGVTATGGTLAYQWYFNGNALLGATSNTLTLSNVSPVNVGSYSVRVTKVGSINYIDSRRAVLEISSDPNRGVVFEDKLEFLALGKSSPLRLGGLNLRPIRKADADSVPFYSVSAGTIGYHLGNNVFGSTDLHETNHCNLIGRGSLYLRFETTSAGTLVIHTGGSLIDNLVAVYRDVPSYDALRTNVVGWATNSVQAGFINRVEIPGVSAGQRFLVVADGSEGESGVLQINWVMGNPPAPASIPPPPVVHANEGEATSLTAGDSSTTNALPAPAYQWYRDRVPIPGATNLWLDLTGPHAGDAGLYYVVITTPFGTVTNYVATVEVKIPFSLVGSSGRMGDGIFELRVSGTPGDPFAMQSTPDLLGWTDLVSGTLPGYTITLSDTNAGVNPVRFYRVVSDASAP